MSFTHGKLLPKLPALTQWSKHFKMTAKAGLSSRVLLANYELAEAALNKVHITERNKITAVEMYSGLGLWSCALINTGIERVIVIENDKKFLPYLKDVEVESRGKITLCERDPFLWETYEALKAPEYLGPDVIQKWGKPHSTLLYTGTIPKSRQSELFIGQLYGCILEKMAMHQFGQLRMLLWLPKSYSMKILAPPGSRERCKLSIVADACAETRIIESTSPNDMFPHYEYDLVDVLPFETSKMTAPTDSFYYVMKHIMVTRRQKLTQVVKMLGPGAEIILGRLDFDPNIEVCKMSAEQVNEVAVRFDEWPLRPKVLHEDTDSMDISRRRGLSPNAHGF